MQESMELQHRQTKSLAPTCFSFLSGDVNNFVVGGEEGSVYTACRHGRYERVIIAHVELTECVVLAARRASRRCSTGTRAR